MFKKDTYIVICPLTATLLRHVITETLSSITCLLIFGKNFFEDGTLVIKRALAFKEKKCVCVGGGLKHPPAPPPPPPGIATFAGYK